MKPVKLTISAWGPYRDKQEILFDKLSTRGIFLIMGATGAGKTTIFDAITYTLYGNMSGSVREKTSVRSDFAGHDTPTCVEFTFLHRGACYTIYRNPEYLRPKKRKSEGEGADAFTTEKEKAVLTLPDGEKIQGSNEVNSKVQEILRLNYKQFKQVSMIAQGEFMKVLLAKPDEKTKVFRELFGTERFEKIAYLLKDKSKDFYQQIMTNRNRMDEDIDLFLAAQEEETLKGATEKGHYYYDAVMEALDRMEKTTEEQLAAETENLHQKEEVLSSLTARRADAVRVQGLFDKLATEQEKQKQLSARREEMELQMQKLSQNEKAVSLHAKKMLLDESGKQIAENEARILQMEKELTALEEQILQKETLYHQREELENAFQMIQQLEDKIRENKERSDMLQKKEDLLCKLKESYLLCEQEEKKEYHLYTGLKESYRHGIAGILASDLLPDTPCPVCGALQHPNPAIPGEAVPTAKQVDQSERAYEQAKAKTADACQKVVLLRTQKEELENVQQTEMGKQELLQKQLDELPPVVRKICSQYSVKQFEQELELHQKRITSKQEKAAFLQERKQEQQTLVKQEQVRREEFLHALKEAGFGSESEYQAALLSEEEVQQRKQGYQRYLEERHTNEELIRHLQEETAETVQPDFDKLEQQYERAKSEAQMLRRQHADRLHRLEQVMQTRASLKKKQALLKQQMEQYSIWKSLCDAANGNNARRLVFEQYVLTSYFEEILTAANIRLQSMSSGRYEMRRVQDIQDGRSKDSLEIEVLDYYTGKYRSVRTLSGGESFKVSLCLALGMSDVVQAENGGILIETLFIDEGFGNLDAESLDQACMVLGRLTESDQLIGIISHVPELAERIPNQIQVQKSNAGSTVKIMLC